MDKISVIIPVYKVEPYLKKCLNSVSLQTYGNFDLVLSDDGSPDFCGSICDDYAFSDDRAIVIHKKNGGLSDARNIGIDWSFSCSDSTWISFIDSDDYVLPQYLELLKTTAINDNSDISFCDFMVSDESGSILEESRVPKKDVIVGNNNILKFLYNNWWFAVAWCKLYKKELFKDLHYSVGRNHEDEFIAHRIFAIANSVSVVNESAYVYLIRSNSITGSKSVNNIANSLEAHIERYWFCRSNDLVLDIRITSYQYFCSLCNLFDSKQKIKKQRLSAITRDYLKLMFDYFGCKSIFIILKYCFWRFLRYEY